MKLSIDQVSKILDVDIKVLKNWLPFKLSPTGILEIDINTLEEKIGRKLDSIDLQKIENKVEAIEGRVILNNSNNTLVNNNKLINNSNTLINNNKLIPNTLIDNSNKLITNNLNILNNNNNKLNIDNNKVTNNNSNKLNINTLISNNIEEIKDNIDFDTQGRIKEEIMNKILNDRIFFIETFLWIRNKDKRLVPFILNNVQKEFVKQHNQFSIVLKARQMGMSSIILALFFVDTILTPYTTSVIITHETEASMRLFDTVKSFYDVLPEALKPVRKYSNRKELYFKDETNVSKSLESRIFIGTAGSKGFGRSSTINNLHCSEVAFWDNFETIYQGLIESVPTHQKTSNIILESTPNGQNHFYDLWKESKKGKTLYKPIFFSWYMFDEYEIPVSEEEIKNWQYLDEEEKYLKEELKLTYNKLKFRRHKISLAKNYEDGKFNFKTEYPTDDIECFISIKNAVIPKTYTLYLNNYVENSRPVSASINLIYPDIICYEHPDINIKYIMGVDTSEGLQDGNWQAIEVFKLQNNQLIQVAEYSGIEDLFVFSKRINDLAKFYNNAFVIVEKNNTGHTVLNNLFYHFGYTNLFAENKNSLGLRMIQSTKILSIEALKTLLRNKMLIIRSEFLLRDIISYTNTKTKGYHYDRLSALLVLTYYIEQLINTNSNIVNTNTNIVNDNNELTKEEIIDNYKKLVKQFPFINEWDFLINL